jgi:uncharacterized protein
MRILPVLALGAVATLAVARTPAPRPPVPRPPLPLVWPGTIEVTGQARVSEAPNRVYIDIGVTTQARSSETAARQNAARISAVVAAVRRASGPSAQLTTTEYSMTPRYQYPHDGGTPTIVGYTASNVVRVRLDDLSRIGRVIDAATEAGSNNVQDIRFALRDEQAARTEALRQAATNARQDAEALAGALGLRIVGVVSVSEQSPAIRPVPIYPQSREFKMSVVAAPTPVEAGTLDVNATVTLKVEVAPAKR